MKFILVLPHLGVDLIHKFYFVNKISAKSLIVYSYKLTKSYSKYYASENSKSTGAPMFIFFMGI